MKMMMMSWTKYQIIICDFVRFFPHTAKKKYGDDCNDGELYKGDNKNINTYILDKSEFHFDGEDDDDGKTCHCAMRLSEILSTWYSVPY